MKISVLTLYFENYKPLADLVLPNWQRYCDKNGYNLVTYCGDYIMPHAPIGFQKVRFAYDTLFKQENEIDALLVLDLDIIITNPEVKVEIFLDDTHDYFVTADVNGLNNGSFIVKKSAGGKAILEYILENKYRHFNEQDMLKFHLDEPLLVEKLKILEHPSINSYWYDLYPAYSSLPQPISGEWSEKDLLLHLPGLSLHHRLELLKSDRAKRFL